MKVKVIPYAAVAAGEMVDKETGEIIKWDSGFECWVFLPDYEYPVQLKLSNPAMKLSVPCTWDIAIVAKRGQLKVQKTFVSPTYVEL